MTHPLTPARRRILGTTFAVAAAAILSAGIATTGVAGHASPQSVTGAHASVVGGSNAN